MLSSPPTISQEDHEEEEGDDDNDESEKSESTDDDNDDGGVNQSDSGSSVNGENDEEDTTEKKPSDEKIDVIEAPKAEDLKARDEEKIYPTHVMYENRNILNLMGNIWSPRQFVQYTVLPVNNVNCFFQNRAQYWRLDNNNISFDANDVCECCGFGFPAQINSNLTPPSNQGQCLSDAITDSLKTFLKNNYVHQQNPIGPPLMSNVQQMPSMNAMQHNNNKNNNNMNGGHQGFNYMNNKRMYNNNVPYAAYQMMQQQQQQQQYQNNQNGFYGNGNGGYNPYNGNNSNNNNAGGYNGTALALLNLMNASRNVSGAAIQATMNNSNRFYNNVNTNNNGFGLYKQF